MAHEWHKKIGAKNAPLFLPIFQIINPVIRNLDFFLVNPELPLDFIKSAHSIVV